ncbi:MAG: polysaccharide biosynthesis protein [Lachnospiraceae bacterium]|nr:polysaccharide biosynthesis protein [Lachnospiraceae bacterium]
MFFQMNEGKKAWLFRALCVCLVDIVALCCASFIALWIRFDFQFYHVPMQYAERSMQLLPFNILILVFLYYIFRLYHSIWRYAGVMEVIRATLVYGVFVPVLILEQSLLSIRLNGAAFLPRSYFFLFWAMGYASCVGIRLSYRLLRSGVRNVRRQGSHDDCDTIMIVGGGEAGRVIVREMNVAKELYGRVACIIDDNKAKWGLYLEGAPIVGGRYEIPAMVEKYGINHIIYAIPTADAASRREILSICKETGCKLQTIPAMYQLINGEVSVSRLRDVEISDLLGRDEIKVNNDEILASIGGKVVMVTGGGGSIGSELCRQIAAAKPKQLIIFDIYENNAYAIQQELKRKYGDELNLVTLIGSVRNSARVNWVLQKYHPEIVFHAAAHKHVPLMEDSPNEAIKNNVMGTYKMGTAAAENGVKRFLLISTDKAVNPTNIMGASKRLCEMAVQMLNRRYEGTDFMAVRFGNVLGSNGSVIPLFKKQIAAGGPVTVTDKNIIRYFMTIPEAVSLVLQASYYAKGGEIFVLDMGDPVRIDDMARNLIKLSGLKPDEDIEIVYTGLRPGEKLFEELLMDEEGMQETANKLIFIGKPIEMDDEKFAEQLKRLNEASKQESDEIKHIVAEVVTTYKVSE